jgi:hypothetical protein
LRLCGLVDGYQYSGGIFYVYVSQVGNVKGYMRRVEGKDGCGR